MDKFQSAIFQYEKCRQEIISLTRQIGEAGLTPFEWDGEVSGGGKSRCTGKEDTGLIFDETCIEMYWGASKEAKEISDKTGEELTAYDILIEFTLCPSCTEVDRLVIERKKAKQQYGIAKRRISQIGKGLINV